MGGTPDGEWVGVVPRPTGSWYGHDVELGFRAARGQSRSSGIPRRDTGGRRNERSLLPHLVACASFGTRGFVSAFRIDGHWIARQRPPSQETTETGFISVFEQPTQYFLHSSQCGPATGLRASGPSLALPLDTPDAKLGEAVLYLMTECRRDAAPPASPDQSRKEALALLKPARVRSWAALQRTARLAHVWVGADGLRVEPTRNGGNRGPDRGFHWLTEQAERLGRSPPPAVLGASVRHALLASTLPPQSSGGLTRA